MGWRGVLWLLLVFLSPGAARGPDPESQTRAHTGSTQGPDPEPTTDSATEVGTASQSLVTLAPRLPKQETRRPSPVTDVSTLCVCDLIAEECDANCCCDPDCSSADVSVFSTCSVRVVKDDDHFCFQKTATYEMDLQAEPPKRLFQLTDKVNPSLFCLYTLNYKDALSFITPEFPNENDFDDFLKKSDNFARTKELDISQPTIPNAPTATKYMYKIPVKTSDSFLMLPCPSVTFHCTDNNPVGFLMNQIFRCNRRVTLEQCGEDKALSMAHYIQPKILAEPNSSKRIPITVRSVLLKSLNKTVTSHPQSDVLLQPTFVNISGLRVCTNVVLQLTYSITYTEAGEITKADSHFLLGTISSSMLPLQQQFQVQFLQQNVKPFPVSGNPGYIPGQPLLAGFEKESRIIQSSNRYRQITVFYSTDEQNCLLAEGLRKPILFGYNMMTSCKLRLNTTLNCQLVEERLKKLLMGQNFPQYVSSFGNSPVQNLQEWVPVRFFTQTLHRREPCVIPMTFEIKVKWTKYGSLVNPQARINSVTAKLTSNYFSKTELEYDNTIQVSTVVSFVDVSAPAKAGYKAQPTIDAKLPSNFFFPFV
ncbi:tectonic-1 [Sminthopsis crassicaudata]|uniref:tectonic-1 n=1 Tax=Sminthopsis crassicaudata TaxID=9301 RepID=UPI003D69958B